MTFDANLWNSTTADSGFTDKEPPVGFHTVTVTEAGFKLTGKDKSTPTIIVEYRNAAGDTWADVKTLTSEGRIKSAKILMRDLGLDPEALTSQDAIHQGLKGVEGGYFDVEVKESTAMKAGGGFYRNTSILGRSQSSAPVAATPAPLTAPTDDDEPLPF
jgi:hypothetical protein